VVTTDPIIAKKYDIHVEREFWRKDEEAEENEADETEGKGRPPEA
jgi:hypothetical protein